MNRRGDRAGLVHCIEPGFRPSKWRLGKARCSRTIGRWTPVSSDPEEVTCETCRRRMKA